MNRALRWLSIASIAAGARAAELKAIGVKMPQWLNVIGVLVFSYSVSRAVLAILPRTRSRRWRLGVAHLVTFALIELFVSSIRGFSIDGLSGYALGQLFWFILDLARDFRPRRARKMRDFLRSPQVGNAIAVIVGSAGALYVGLGFINFTQNYGGYRRVPINGTVAEVRYALANPSYVRNGSSESWRKTMTASDSADWLYPDPQMRVIFDAPGGRVHDIVCRQPRNADTGPCPAVFGLATGSTEDNLFYVLGSPTQVEYDPGGRKTVSYPELGLDFLLEQFRITSIRVYASDGDKLRKLGRLIIWLIP